MGGAVKDESKKRVLVLGATGTAGQGTARALVAAGHHVVALVRSASKPALPEGVTPFVGDVTREADLRAALAAHRSDAVVSCLASRTGASGDAWAIDHDAHQMALAVAQANGVGQFVLMSAICVQKPRLPFQRAKLEFEKSLMESGMVYSIVRPTALFKSLSGQVGRLRAGKPFLLFGNGALTACKPISTDDLGRYMARCLTDPDLQNSILPIGGPGPAQTPREMGEALFAALDLEPRFRSVPPVVLRIVAGVLSLGGLVSKGLKDKAELARIGHYYATQSMAILDADNRYDPEGTPSTGSETLADHYARLAAEEVPDDRGAHAVF